MSTTPIADENVIELTESERVYDFGDGRTVTLRDVRKLVIRSSGTHRVVTADGKLHVVDKGWVAIHIDDNGKTWTV